MLPRVDHRESEAVSLHEASVRSIASDSIREASDEDIASTSKSSRTADRTADRTAGVEKVASEEQSSEQRPGVGEGDHVRSRARSLSL